MSRDVRTTVTRTLTNYLNREGVRDRIINFGIEQFERYGRGIVMALGYSLAYVPASKMYPSAPGKDIEHIEHIGQLIEDHDPRAEARWILRKDDESVEDQVTIRDVENIRHIEQLIEAYDPSLEAALILFRKRGGGWFEVDHVIVTRLQGRPARNFHKLSGLFIGLLISALTGGFAVYVYRTEGHLTPASQYGLFLGLVSLGRGLWHAFRSSR